MSSTRSQRSVWYARFQLIVAVLAGVLLFAMIANISSLSPAANESVEVKFADRSKSGLAIVPASCPSSPHYSGECSPPTCTVTITPNPIARGGGATVSWSSTNATSLTLTTIGPVALSGSTSVAPISNTNYGGTVTGTAGSATCPATLTVTQPTASMTVNGGSIHSANIGESTQWNWSSTFGSTYQTLVTLDAPDTCGNPVGPFAWGSGNTASGSYNYTWTSCSAGRTYNYSYRVTNSAGYAVTSAATVSIGGLPACSINLTPSSILAGQNAALDWATSNADSGSISPTIGNAGTAPTTFSVSPNITTTYTGTVSKTTTSLGTTQTIYLTSGSSWTVPANWNAANNTIEVIGGGSGGTVGAAGSTGASGTWGGYMFPGNGGSGGNGGAGGTGGGAGGYSKATNASLTPGASLTVSVGTGGGAGGGTGGDTYIGGSSCVTSIACAKGGAVGAAGGASASLARGGVGGSVTAPGAPYAYGGGNGSLGSSGGAGSGGAGGYSCGVYRCGGNGGGGGSGGYGGAGGGAGGPSGAGSNGVGASGGAGGVTTPAATNGTQLGGAYGSGGGAHGAGTASGGSAGSGTLLSTVDWVSVIVTASTPGGMGATGGTGGTSGTYGAGGAGGAGGGGGGGGGGGSEQYLDRYTGTYVLPPPSGGGSGGAAGNGSAGKAGVIKITYTPTISTTNTATCSATLSIVCAPIYSCSGAVGSDGRQHTIDYTSNTCVTTSPTTCPVPSYCQSGQSSCVYPPPEFTATGNKTGNLQASPQLVRKGTPAKLFWNVTNVASCTVTGNNGDTLNAGCVGTTCSSSPSGTDTMNISSSALYTLSCTALSGNSFTPESVTVLPSPEYVEI